MYYGNKFDFISRSPAIKVCLLSQKNSAGPRQKAVLFTLQVSRYCLLDFQGRIVIRIPLIALISSMTQCSGSFKRVLQWRPIVGGTGPKYYHQ